MSDLNRRKLLERAILVGAAAAIHPSHSEARTSQDAPQVTNAAQKPADQGATQPTVTSNNQSQQPNGNRSSLPSSPRPPATSKSSVSTDNPGDAVSTYVDTKHTLNEARKVEATDLASDVAATPAPATEPFKRDEHAWTIVKQRAAQLYAVENSSIGGTVDPNILNIDNSFAFSQSAQDVHFFFNHVEDLLSDAATLLDRCLRERDTWNDHLTKRFTIANELREYFALDAIHADETAAGYYRIASQESAALLNGEIANQQGMYAAAGFLDWLVETKYNNDELNRQSGQQQLAAWISHLAGYERPETGNFVNSTWDGASDTLPNFAKNAAFITSWHQYSTQMALLQSQSKTQSTSSSVSAMRVNGYRARSEWDKKDADFRKRRTQVARDTADLRSRSFTEPGGALNFSERMIPVRERFSRDYRDALARIFAAKRGLELVFGYKETLPASLEAMRTASNNANSSTFDSCLAWVRDALTWLSAFTQNDQNYVLPISLKRAMSQAAWSKGIRDGGWEFNIPEKVFAGQRHVRLRGLSAFVGFDRSTPDPNRDSSTWQITIVAPDQGRSYHLDNSQIEIDQTTAPPTRLGRVTPRNVLQTPDVAGAIGLKNLSPIGRWKVGISKTSTEGVSISELQDVYIDLHLSVRSDLTQRLPTAVPTPTAS